VIHTLQNVSPQGVTTGSLKMLWQMVHCTDITRQEYEYHFQMAGILIA
jgi:hypothetical protein